jgi:hypothetical protein
MPRVKYGSPFNPRNWYWIVGDNPTQVYSSAQAVFVSIDDQTYQDWLALPTNNPTVIANSTALQEVLDGIYPLGTPSGQVLDLLNQGLAITSNSNSSLNGTYAIDSAACQTINSITTGITNKSMTLPGGGSTFVYPDIDGDAHSWNINAFTDFAQTVMNYVYAVRMNAATNGGMSIPPQPINIDNATMVLMGESP